MRHGLHIILAGFTHLNIAIRHPNLFCLLDACGSALLASELAPAERLSPMRKLFLLRVVGLAISAANDRVDDH